MPKTKHDFTVQSSFETNCFIRFSWCFPAWWKLWLQGVTTRSPSWPSISDGQNKTVASCHPVSKWRLIAGKSSKIIYKWRFLWDGRRNAANAKRDEFPMKSLWSDDNGQAPSLNHGTCNKCIWWIGSALLASSLMMLLKFDSTNFRKNWSAPDSRHPLDWDLPCKSRLVKNVWKVWNPLTSTTHLTSSPIRIYTILKQRLLECCTRIQVSKHSSIFFVVTSTAYSQDLPGIKAFFALQPSTDSASDIRSPLRFPQHFFCEGEEFGWWFSPQKNRVISTNHPKYLPSMVEKNINTWDILRPSTSWFFNMFQPRFSELFSE